eukprot:2769661-Prymnesium_polylepis.1
MRRSSLRAAAGHEVRRELPVEEAGAWLAVARAPSSRSTPARGFPRTTDETRMRAYCTLLPMSDDLRL